VPGLGLGLPIVAAIARAHHATLTISPRPGGGLNITFPTATRPTAAPHAALLPARQVITDTRQAPAGAGMPPPPAISGVSVGVGSANRAVLKAMTLA
jgi:hypothetical protein